MKTVRMTLDDEFVNAVDRVAKQLHTSRSAFTRMGLCEALPRHDGKQRNAGTARAISGTRPRPTNIPSGKPSR